MTIDMDAREQRLRKQAELQSLSVYLANLRERESSYIQASAAVPELLVNQINEMRQGIRKLEEELLDLGDQSVDTPAHQFYWDAFTAELAGDLAKALKLYKSASRYTYPDASAAIRSVRYKMKGGRARASRAGQSWPLIAPSPARGRLLLSLLLLLILIVVVVLAVSGGLAGLSGPVVTELPTSTPTFTAVIVMLVSATPVPVPTVTPTALMTATPTLVPAPTPRPTAPHLPATPTLMPTPTPTLRPAPRIIEPKNGLTWGDGTIVFEFEKLDLDYDELYCVNTLRGYDETHTENWSYPAVGSKEPRIAIEANVFRVARTQGMKCIVWSAGIGKVTCDRLISYPTEERVIGLPQPCKFE